MNLPVIVLAGVFLLTAVRQVGSLKLQIWQIMPGGALLVLGAGSISPGAALAASNVIIIQNAERRKGGTITFLGFAQVGVPLTIVNGTVYWLCLKYL